MNQDCNKLTDTQDAALQYLFAEYNNDTWNDCINMELQYSNHKSSICDWFKDNSYSEIKEMLICLEQMLQTKYEEGYMKAKDGTVWSENEIH